MGFPVSRHRKWEHVISQSDVKSLWDLTVHVQSNPLDNYESSCCPVRKLLVIWSYQH